MRDWWKKKKEKTRKYKKSKEDYTFWDLLFDVLIFIPELLLLPFRIIFWILRGIAAIIGEVLGALF